MDHSHLLAIIQKYTGRSEAELQMATWDEIDGGFKVSQEVLDDLCERLSKIGGD